MSRVYFHSKEKTAEVFGSERAHAHLLVDHLGKAMLGVYADDPMSGFSLSKFLPSSAYALRRINMGVGWISLYRADLDLYLSSLGWDENYLHIGEQRFNPWNIYLNTAITVGPNPIRFMARLHATCEIHGYVEGPNRKWLADIIEDGLDKFILRESLQGSDTGWHSVIELLRARNDGPVVMSYSVCDQFPNAHIAYWPLEEWQAPPKPDDYADIDDDDWRSEAASDAWYDLPTDKQWDLALAGLRKENERGRIEMRPEDFAEQGFGDGVDAFMFLHQAQAQPK